MKVLVTGGAGYVGHRLVPALLGAGHEVIVMDTYWFGNYFKPHPNLAHWRSDIRDVHAFRGIDTVIHLACLSNDPSSEIDAELTKSINLDAFEPLVVDAKRAGVKRFIYCSSSSVYGVSDSPDVTEDHPLVPITLYNRYKAECEPLLFKHQSDDFVCTVLRPSTICGYSPRMRLDLAVNILTNLAVNTGTITVHGGQQMRPNLHIDDMVDAYLKVLKAPVEKVAGQTFNVGERNYTIMQLAELVQEVVPAKIEVVGTVDPRSYKVNSDKIRDVLGFVPSRTVRDAITDLVRAFDAGLLPSAMTDDRYYNVKRMRRIFGDLYRDAPPLKVDPAKGHLSEIDVVHR